jgi:hypothetical protein
VREKASLAILAVICLLVFVGGVFVGNITARVSPKTVTETVTAVLREETTAYTTMTVTAEPPLLVVARAELQPSCIYNATVSGPEEDPNCTRNIKAVTLLLVVRNVGKIPVRVNPHSILLHAFGASTSPYLTNPEGEVILEPGSYSKQIIAVYFVNDTRGFVRFHNEFGSIVSVAYSDQEGKCPERIDEKPELIPGVWWPG